MGEPTLKTLLNKRAQFELYARLTALAEGVDHSDGKSLLAHLQERFSLEKALKELHNNGKKIQDDIGNLSKDRAVALKDKQTYERIVNAANTTDDAESTSGSTLQTVGMGLAEASERLRGYDERQKALDGQLQANALATTQQQQRLDAVNADIELKIHSIAELLLNTDGFDEDRLDKARQFLASKQLTTKTSAAWQHDADLEGGKIDVLRIKLDGLKAQLKDHKLMLAQQTATRDLKQQRLAEIDGELSAHKRQLGELRAAIDRLEKDKRDKEQELRELSAYDHDGMADDGR